MTPWWTYVAAGFIALIFLAAVVLLGVVVYHEVSDRKR